MDGYDKYIAASDNQSQQIQSGRNAQPSSLVDAMAEVTSKKDLYDHMQNQLQYYMPSYEMWTKDFAKEIFSGRKRLLKMREVRFINVTKYEELSVKNLYDHFLTLDGMNFYFPDKFPKGRQCDREYMFNIANSLYEEITMELIHHALKQRNAIESDKKKEESVLISQHWKEELKSLPMSASKKGKMVALLKQKSKITIQHKPRVKYPIKSIFKKPKIDPSVSAASKSSLDAAFNFNGTGTTTKKIQPEIIEQYDDNMDGNTKE